MQAAIRRPYVAWEGYRRIDVGRYERRRYGGLLGRMNFWCVRRALARALADADRGRPLLDAPCGSGILRPFLEAQGFRVVSADVSPSMLQAARERGATSTCVRTDLEALPFRPRSFGAVVCSRFLMHLPADTRPRVLRGLAELTTGPVVATVCHPYTTKYATRQLRRVLRLRFKSPERLTRAALAAEAAAAGLRVDAIIPVVPLFSELWIVVMQPA